MYAATAVWNSVAFFGAVSMNRPGFSTARLDHRPSSPRVPNHMVRVPIGFTNWYQNPVGVRH